MGCAPKIYRPGKPKSVPVSVKHDTPSKWNILGALDVTQGSAMAWYRDSRYQACACSKGNVHESESRIDQESSRKAKKKKSF